MAMSTVNNISGKSLGRRPAGEDTKGKIIAAAQSGFAEYGYDRTSFRQIAATAGVDPALVVHYFGTKQQLFVAAMLPLFEVPKLLPDALAGDRASIGHRLANLFVTLITNEATRKLMLGMFRSVSSEEQAASIVRNFVQGAIVDQVQQHLPGPNQALQANIVSGQLIGIFVARHIVKIEPLASVSNEELIEYLAPRLQAHFE